MPKMFIITKPVKGNGYEVVEADDRDATRYPDLESAKKAIDKVKGKDDRVIVS